MALPSLRLVSSDSDAVALVDSAPGVDIDELFRKYAADIASLGLAMLGKKDEADDLVQEVFLRAFRGIKNLRDRLFRVLEGLGVDLRLAWILRYLQSETAEVVAEQCGWSLSTTKRRIRAAHDKVLKGMGS